jgi:hypothetical protein
MRFFSISMGSAHDNEWNVIGLRVGINDNRNSEFFSKYEVYATFSLLKYDIICPWGEDKWKRLKKGLKRFII